MEPFDPLTFEGVYTRALIIKKDFAEFQKSKEKENKQRSQVQEKTGLDRCSQ